MQIQAIIFDMDGLMLDTEPLYRMVWKRAAAACGYNLTDEIYRGLVGRGRIVAEQILSQTFGPGFPMEKFRKLSREDEVRAFSFDPIEKKPGLEELLSFVESRNLPKAVATSTERSIAIPLLARMGLLERFSVLATGDEVAKGKPHPDLFLLVARRLKVDPPQCLVLEDSEAGVMAASAAAMPVFMVPDLVEPSDKVRHAATGVFQSLGDVVENLKVRAFVPAEHYSSCAMIRTRRLIALPLSQLDEPNVRMLNRDPQVMATLGGVRTDEETRRWMRENLEHWERNGFGTWVFRDLKNGQVAGRAAIRRVVVEGESEIELGYVLASEFWGQGLATEMGEAILLRGHPSVQQESVIALIAASNVRSLRVAARLGFRFERNVIWKGLPTTLHRLNARGRDKG